MPEIELCGFMEGRGLSYEKCQEEGQKKEEKSDFTCSKCGSHRYGEYNANRFCADCGANQVSPEAEKWKGFEVPEDVSKLLKGI